MAASLLAAQRLELAETEELPALRLSIRKIARHMRQAALVLSLSHDLMSAAQQRTFVRRFEKMLRREARIPPRRQRIVPGGCANRPPTGRVSVSAAKPMAPAFYPSSPSPFLHGIGLQPPLLPDDFIRQDWAEGHASNAFTG
jgi:hypothetical protein